MPRRHLGFSEGRPPSPFEGWGQAFLRALLIGGLLGLGGGGCGSRPSSPFPAQGKLRVVLQRPTPGRLIPQRTARFHLQVSRPGGPLEVDETFDLPPAGTIQREYSLRIGIVEVAIEAQASDGTVLASQSALAEIKEGETTSVTLEFEPRPNILPQLNLTAFPSTVKTDEPVTVQWSAVDDDQLVRVEVDTNGDGTLESVQATGSVQVSFPNPGTFALRGETEDNDGLIAQAVTQIQVQPRLGQLDIIVK